MSEPQKRVGVYETGDGRTIHLGRIVEAPARPVLHLPFTQPEIGVLLRAARSARICGLRWSEM